MDSLAFLLDFDADIVNYYRTDDGESGLFLACQANQFDVACALIAAGADSQISDTSQYHSITPLESAALCADVRLTKKILEWAYPDASAASLHHVLEACVVAFVADDGKQRRLENIQHLLTYGLDTTRPDEAEPLVFLATANLHESIPMLVAAGSSINWQRNGSRMSALHSAALLQKTDAMALLLRAGANPDLQDKMGLTPLHVSLLTERNKERIVTACMLLLEGGADPTIADCDGITPLSLVADNPDLLVVMHAYAAKKTMADVIAKAPNKVSGSQP